MSSSRPLDTELPLVAAPMAGGPSTTALVRAVAGAGGLGFFAAGYKTPGRMAEELDTARGWGVPFGVNLFVPNDQPYDEQALNAYAAELADEAAALGAEVRFAPGADDDHWADKIALLLDAPVPAVSFSFALPDRSLIAELKGRGTVVLQTVTTLDEARAALDAGVDALVVQGPRAGGHSATWTPTRAIEDFPTARIVARIRALTSVPIIGTGGVDGPGTVREIMAAGADGVAIGTLLVRAEESGASPVYQDALVSGEFTRTTITRAFTGRPARGLHNGFIERHGEHAPTAYPAVHRMTSPMRTRAWITGDTDRLSLWAGTGFASAQAAPTAQILHGLASQLP